RSTRCGSAVVSFTRSAQSCPTMYRIGRWSAMVALRSLPFAVAACDPSGQKRAVLGAQDCGRSVRAVLRSVRAPVGGCRHAFFVGEWAHLLGLRVLVSVHR